MIFSNNKDFKKNVLKREIKISGIKEENVKYLTVKLNAQRGNVSKTKLNDETFHGFEVKRVTAKYIFIPIYAIELTKPIAQKEVVAKALKRRIKLNDIKKVKDDYFLAYQQLLDELNNKKAIAKKKRKKRFIQYASVLCLFIAALGMIYMSQTKEVKLIVDGIEHKLRTNQFFTSLFAKKIAEKHDFEDYKYTCSTNNVLEDDSIISISQVKEVKTYLKGKETANTTYANTLSEFMNEKKGDLSQYKGKYSYFIKEYQDPAEHEKVYLNNVDELHLYLMSKKVKEETIVSKHGTKYVDNDKLESGTLKVKQKGQDGKYIKTFETIYLNDRKYKTVTRISKVIHKKKDKIVERGTRVVQAGDSVWDRLAKCESGGRWHLNSGNGFYGGLQFSAATWRTAAAKVGVTAAYAHLASKADQIKAAVWLQKNSGWGQWPHCSSKLGLR